MTKKQKYTVLLNIFCKDKLLLRTVRHPDEDYEVLDSFGAILPEDTQPYEIAQDLASKLRSPYLIEQSGVMVDHVRKPDGVVRLKTYVFKVVLVSSSQVNMHSNFDWYNKEDLERDERFQRDKHLTPYYFAEKPFSIEFAEDQMNAWKDAKLLWLRELPRD